ncbi:MAG: ATP-binding protein [Vicinamibacterales bacterium]
MTLDARGRLLRFNAAAAETFGLEAGRDLECDGAGRLLAAASQAAFEDGLRSLATAERGSDDPASHADGRLAAPRLFVRGLTGRRADGTEFPLDAAISREHDAAGPWFAVCLRDVSERRDAEARLRHRARTAQLGADVGLALTKPGPLSQALAASAAAIVRRLDARLACVWVLDESGEAGDGPAGEGTRDGDAPASFLRLVACAGVDDRADDVDARIEAGQTTIGRVAGTGEPLLSNDVAGDPALRDLPWRVGGLRSFAAQPLRLDDAVVGVVAMGSAHVLTEVDQESLAAVARKLALGLARQRGIDALRLRAAELTRSARALERSNRDLDQFAYIASHDLRAPLRGIANLAEWIEEDLGEAVPEAVRGHLALLRGRVTRMDGLIEGILQYARAGRISMTEARVDTVALVHEAIDLLEPPEGSRVDVAPDLPVLVAPPAPLQQVFLNLIGNALKYAGGADARVTVTASRMADGVRFAIADNGPGIAPEYHARIWGVFQRLEARDQVEGTGIGLALVKKIVEAVGGQVGVESDVGRGATFHFTWPERPIDSGRGR